MVIATGFGATVTIMFKCQLVLPRFGMSQNPAANIDDLPEVADASIWNLAIVLQHKEASSFEASGPPGTLLHDSWGEGFASDLGASLPHVEAFFPV